MTETLEAQGYCYKKLPVWAFREPKPYSWEGGILSDMLGKYFWEYVEGACVAYKALFQIVDFGDAAQIVDIDANGRMIILEDGMRHPPTPPGFKRVLIPLRKAKWGCCSCGVPIFRTLARKMGYDIVSYEERKAMRIPQVSE